MSKNIQKIYCYVDESGQETQGQFFLVSVVVTDETRDALKAAVEVIEKKVKLGLTKWHKTSFTIRIAYLEAIFAESLLKKTIYFGTYTNTKEYIDLTVLTTAKAITLSAHNQEYKATVLVDGLNYYEVGRFAKGLRQLGIMVKKVRGKRDESDCLIRLADNMAGFIRDAIEKKSYAQKLYEKAVKNKFIQSTN